MRYSDNLDVLQNSVISAQLFACEFLKYKCTSGQYPRMIAGLGTAASVLDYDELHVGAVHAEWPLSRLIRNFPHFVGQMQHILVDGLDLLEFISKDEENPQVHASEKLVTSQNTGPPGFIFELTAKLAFFSHMLYMPLSIHQSFAQKGTFIQIRENFSNQRNNFTTIRINFRTISSNGLIFYRPGSNWLYT